MIDTILKYFPGLTGLQRSMLERCSELYPEWNAKINVISRKDIDNLEVHHILHSLAIARFIQFAPQSRVLDFGCGGGFPGIPLAVMFPSVRFHLIDRIAKKLRVASAIAADIGLANVSFQHGDIAECNIASRQMNALPNGLVTLKGGDLTAEIEKWRRQTVTEPIGTYFPDDEWFADKYVTYTPIVPVKG